jgi:hypothetical protein
MKLPLRVSQSTKNEKDILIVDATGRVAATTFSKEFAEAIVRYFNYFPEPCKSREEWLGAKSEFVAPPDWNKYSAFIEEIGAP